MEPCVDLVDYNSSTMVVIKQPGSVRHTQSGQAIEKIEMTVGEAVELHHQLGKMLDKAGAIVVIPQECFESGSPS